MSLFKVIKNNQNQPPFILVNHLEKKVLPVHRFLTLQAAKGLSVNTIRAYAFDLRDFYCFLSESQIVIQKLAHQNIINFILAHKRKNAAPRTINRRLIVICDFLNQQFNNLGDKTLKLASKSFYKGRRNKALLGPSRIKDDKYLKTLSVKVPSLILQPLKPEEVKKFLANLRTYRDKALVYLMLFCGLRSCETLNLELNDIDFITNKITVNGKGLKQRVIPMPSSVHATLNHYINYERQDNLPHNKLITVLKGPLGGQPLTSEGLRKIFRYHRYKTSLLRVHPHLFRHTFCTNLILQKVPLPIIQKLMGHSDIEVTMVYVHMGIDDVAREYHQALEVLQKLHGQKDKK